MTLPRVVMRPIELFPELVNHKAPSGPAVIPVGPSIPVPVKMAAFPLTVMRPIELPL